MSSSSSPADAASASPFLTDRALARRLERTEGTANAAFVESHARLDPDSAATWIDVGGTYAMYDGAGSPLTQTFGLGLFAELSAEELATIERFFESRGAGVFHEVCPLADAKHLALLVERGYVPIEQSSVLCRTLDGADGSTRRPSEVRARPIRPGEEDVYAETGALGWGETPELGELMRTYGRMIALARGAVGFLAELEGRPIATGAMVLHEGVALLAGASTIPEWRGRGAQGVLLASRLRHAAEQGCDLAMMVAAPGSVSQLNAERAGFRMAYTRTKWEKRGA